MFIIILVVGLHQPGILMSILWFFFGYRCYVRLKIIYTIVHADYILQDTFPKVILQIGSWLGR